ncbi:MAG: metallophosphoesterase [Nanoarchaeota archaeon]
MLFVDRALKLKKHLVISDLHSGIESLLLEKGSNFPKILNKIMIKRLNEVQEFTKTNKLIINGDIKHEFNKVKSEILDLKTFFKEIKEHWDEILVIKGNHDLFIENIVRPFNIPVFKRINIRNKIIITHGDKLYEDFLEKTFIIGNEHPTLKIRELNFEEAVFLANKKLIVVPSFNPFLKGSNVLNKEFLSPYFDYLREKGNEKDKEFNVILSKLENKKLEVEKLGKIKV